MRLFILLELFSLICNAFIMDDIMHLKEKSRNNIECALFLVQEQFFCSSVHCSYYSCIQYIKHLLLNKFDLTEDDIENLRKGKEGDEIKRVGLHDALHRYMRSKINPESKKIFDREFYALKKARVDAGYLNISIGEKTAKEAARRAEGFLELLKKVG